MSSVSLGLSDLTRTENSEEDPTPGMHSSITFSTVQDAMCAGIASPH